MGGMWKVYQIVVSYFISFVLLPFDTITTFSSNTVKCEHLVSFLPQISPRVIFLIYCFFLGSGFMQTVQSHVEDHNGITQDVASITQQVYPFVYAYKYGIAMSIDFFEKYAPEEYKSLDIDGCFIFKLTRPASIYFFSFGFSGFLAEHNDTPMEVHWAPTVVKKWMRMNGWFMHRMDGNAEFGLRSSWYAINAKAAGAVLLKKPDTASYLRLAARIKHEMDEDRKLVANQEFMFGKLSKQEEMSEKRSFLKVYSINGTQPQYTPEGVFIKPKVSKLQLLRMEHRKWMHHMQNKRAEHINVPNPMVDTKRTEAQRIQTIQIVSSTMEDLFGDTEEVDNDGKPTVEDHTQRKRKQPSNVSGEKNGNKKSDRNVGAKRKPKTLTQQPKRKRQKTKSTQPTTTTTTTTVFKMTPPATPHHGKAIVEPSSTSMSLINTRLVASEENKTSNSQLLDMEAIVASIEAQTPPIKTERKRGHKHRQSVITKKPLTALFDLNKSHKPHYIFSGDRKIPEMRTPLVSPLVVVGTPITTAPRFQHMSDFS